MRLARASRSAVGSEIVARRRHTRADTIKARMQSAEQNARYGHCATARKQAKAVLEQLDAHRPLGVYPADVTNFRKYIYGVNGPCHGHRPARPSLAIRGRR